MKKLTAMDVAKYFVGKDANETVFTTNRLYDVERRPFEGSVRLNKMLQMAQNIHIAKYGCRLFDDQFFAYDNGAVIKIVRESYFKLIKNRELHGFQNITGETRHFLDLIYIMFCKAPIRDFIELSHEDEAWIDAIQKGYDSIMDTMNYKEIYKEQYSGAIILMDAIDRGVA